MANDSHISEPIREQLDKLGPEKKQRVLDVADRGKERPPERPRLAEQQTRKP